VSGNQLWKIEPLADGYYKLVAKHSGKVLDVANASLEDGAQVFQYTDFAATYHNQQWRLQPVAVSARAATGGKGEESPIQLYPNPARGQLTVALPFAASQVTATAVTDLAGRQHLHNAHKASGPRQLLVPLGTLPAGLYLLRLQAGPDSRVIRFSKR
jgi:hypothetical protein